MGVLCFVADLPALPPESLRRLKQCWLQLANYYAVAPPFPPPPPPPRRSAALGDRIALCYVCFDRLTASRHLKIAYSPGENFDLCGFHRAVGSVPADAFVPDSPALSRCDTELLRLLSDESIYSWSSEDIARKIVVLTSSLPPEMDAALHDSLMDAADKCVSVEFLLLEMRSVHLRHVQENMSKFVRSISDLDNCSVSACLPDARVLDGMTKRWLQYIRDQVEESLQARFIFNNDLASYVNQISCNLSISSYQLIDGFSYSQTGNWHEIIKEEVLQSEIGNNLKVGEGRILPKPSSLNSMKSQLVCSPIDFNVIERTNLSSLSEGVLIGTPHVAIPSVGPEIGAASSGNNLELNTELFQGLCWVLQSLDQGLVCSSNYNMETRKTSIFPCYYLLQPSDNGPMLLRRLAGLEEVLPLPDIDRHLSCPVSKETEGAIKASILKMESRDYNPILHDRGFHQRMNLLVEQRSESGSVPQELDGTSSESKSSQPEMSGAAVPASEELTLKVLVVEGEPPNSRTKSTAEEEWGQLLVTEMPNVLTPTCISKLTSESAQAIDLSSADGLVQNDAKISRILERLEAPRQSNPRATSPAIAGILATKNSPRLTHVAEQGLVGNELMKPSFNSKRKRQ